MYESGFYWTGIGHHFIEFPSRQKNINLNSLRLRSSDGITVTVDVSYQYRVSKESVPKLFQQYGLQYELHFNEIIKNELRNIASKYKATEFYDSREFIGMQMNNITTEKIKSLNGVLEGFQLKTISLPSEYELYIRAKTATEQKIAQAKSDYSVAVTAANTRAIEAENDVKVSLLRAEGEEEGRIIGKLKEIEGYQTKTLKQTDAHEEFSTALNLTSEMLLAYLWIQNLRSGNHTRRIVNIDKPNNIWTIQKN